MIYHFRCVQEGLIFSGCQCFLNVGLLIVGFPQIKHFLVCLLMVLPTYRTPLSVFFRQFISRLNTILPVFCWAPIGDQLGTAWHDHWTLRTQCNVHLFLTFDSNWWGACGCLHHHPPIHSCI